eukprot:5259909-Amphidinium_carterae.1
MARKQLQSEQGKAETEAAIAEQEEMKKQREARVVELKNKCEAIERRVELSPLVDAAHVDIRSASRQHLFHALVPRSVLNLVKLRRAWCSL